MPAPATAPHSDLTAALETRRFSDTHTLNTLPAIPLPAAEFSPLTTANWALNSRRNSGSSALTAFLPPLPTTSPRKIKFISKHPGNQ
jgi:hypothetical protein